MNLKNSVQPCSRWLVLGLKLLVAAIFLMNSCISKEATRNSEKVELVQIEVPYEKDDVVGGALAAWSSSEHQKSNRGETLDREEVPQGDVPQKAKILALQQALLEGNFEALRTELPRLNPEKSRRPFSDLLIMLLDFQLGNSLKARAQLNEVQKSFEANRSKMAPKLAAEFQYLFLVSAGAIELSLGNREHGFELLSEARNLMPKREEHGLLLARYFRENGELHLALRIMNEVFGSPEEKSAGAFLEMLVLQRALRNLSQEQLLLRRALELYPEDVRFDIYLAKDKFLYESQIAGCESFANIYRKNPTDSQSAFNHALCLSLRGDHKASIHVLEKAVATHSASDRLKLLLASVKAQSQNVLGAGMVLNSLRSLEEREESAGYYAGLLLGALADDPERRDPE